MSKLKMVDAALLGSSSALGLNWIYDKELLEEYSKDNEVLFIPIDHELYKKAKTGFDVYPKSQVGDLDFMGEILRLFHSFLNDKIDISPSNFRKVVYNYIKQDGVYDAYIESYGNDLIKKYEDEQYNYKEQQIYTDYEDKQLIGLALFTAIYENPKFTDKVSDSLKYAKVFTSYKEIEDFTNLLNHLFDDLKNGVEKEDALLNSIQYAPFDFQEQLKHSLHKVDSHYFIDKFAGVACDISQAIPLIYHIVAHNNSWEDALTQNAILGGASSARGILISAIFNIIDIIPIRYQDKLNTK